MELWLVTVNLLARLFGCDDNAALSFDRFDLSLKSFFSCLRNIIIINFPDYNTQQIVNWLNEIINK